MTERRGCCRTGDGRRAMEEAKDTGMALVLILLLLGQILHENKFILAAIVALILDMTWPQIYRRPSIAWMGLSRIAGASVTKILLAGTFFLIVLPVGLIRRLLGKDAMKLNQWKKGTRSVFRERNHLFQADELERPF